MEDSNEQMKEQIALEMAEYFEKRVTASELSGWVIDILHALIEDDSIGNWEKSNCAGVISSMSYSVITPLFKCTSREERIDVLKTGLIEFFDTGNQPDNKAALRIAGVAIINTFVKYSECSDEIGKRLNILSVLLSLCEMYDTWYMYCRKETKKAA